jgi:hypothetical protein
MKTAIMRRAFLVTLGVCAGVVGIVASGCDNRHVLGTVDDAATPPWADGSIIVDAGPHPSGDGGIIVDARPSLADGGDTREVGVLGPSESWTGYVENYRFRSGSDVVKIAFASDPAGQLVGTVTLGSGTPPPPASDPNVGYPADLVAGSLPGAARAYIAEGYEYSLRAGTLTNGRLRFGVGTWELWTGWCALQTPVPPQGVCDEPVCQGTCLPNWGSMSGPNGCGLLNPATNQYEPVDCGKLALCGFGGVCTCYASCTVRDNGTQITFDVALTNGAGSGSVAGGLGDHNVHFTKDP